jgi:hypothetical protein
VVKVAICRSGKLKRAEMNVIKSLIINTECLIRVLDELVDGKRSIIGLITPLVLKQDTENMYA